MDAKNKAVSTRRIGNNSLFFQNDHFEEREKHTKQHNKERPKQSQIKRMTIQRFHQIAIGQEMAQQHWERKNSLAYTEFKLQIRPMANMRLL